MVSRRHFILGACAAPLYSAATAAQPIEVFTADVRPLSIPDGPRRGLVLDIVAQALRPLDYEARFTFLPFAEAMQRTVATPGALIAPLARTPQREPQFAWIAKIIDVPQAMGTRSDRPALDLAGAKSAGKLGIVRGGVQEGFLRENGFANMVPFATANDIAKALAAGEIDAWYSTATEMALQFEQIGRPGGVRIGPTIQLAPVWLASGSNVTGLPVQGLRDSIAKLEATGRIQAIYADYVKG